MKATLEDFRRTNELIDDSRLAGPVEVLPGMFVSEAPEAPELSLVPKERDELVARMQRRAPTTLSRRFI